MLVAGEQRTREDPNRRKMAHVVFAAMALAGKLDTFSCAFGASFGKFFFVFVFVGVLSIGKRSEHIRNMSSLRQSG
jgi:hypothetical protein